MTKVHLFLKISHFKEQSENQNLGDGADEILRYLKLKNVNRLVMVIWISILYVITLIY